MKSLENFDWAGIAAHLDAEGFAVLPGVFSPSECLGFQGLAKEFNSYQMTLGSGDVLAPHSLPSCFEDVRRELFARLLPVANRWQENMENDRRFGTQDIDMRTLAELPASRPGANPFTVLASRQMVPLGQLAAELHPFPLRSALLLSQPGEDFDGGELVLTEQRPRMQTRPMVPALCRGDVIVFAAHRRPHRGAKGFYKVNTKFAVSRVHSGERISLDMTFQEPRC